MYLIYSLRFLYMNVLIRKVSSLGLTLEDPFYSTWKAMPRKTALQPNFCMAIKIK